MSGPERRRQHELTPEARPERESSAQLGVFGGGISNSGQAEAAAAARAHHVEETALELPDLGTPTRSVWEVALTDAFDSGLQGFMKELPKTSTETTFGPTSGATDWGAAHSGEDRSGVEVLGDAGKKFASEAAMSLVETGFERMGGTEGALDLAREYPVPAAVLAAAAGYGASVWLDGKPTLKLKIKLSPISDKLSTTVKHDLKTGESSFMLRFKYEW